MTRFTALDNPDWLALFADLSSSWFRLETLQHYSVDYEDEEFQRFQRTGTLDRPFRDWQLMIARHVNAGRTLRRVHVVEQPHSSYVDYEMAAYRINSRAGEDIRIIPVSAGRWPDDLPQGYDFWLFDDADVWVMEYDETGRFLAAQQAGPDELDLHRRWRDAALAAAVPLSDYTTAHTS